MSDFDVSVRALASSHTVDEVSQVTVELIARVRVQPLFRVVNFPAAAVDDERAFFTVERNSGTASFQAVVTPQSMLPQNGVTWVVERGCQRVGHFLAALENVVSAGSADSFWKVQFQSPPSDVQQVHSPVAEFPDAVLVEPLPVMVETMNVKGSFCGRPEPEVVVDSLRYRLVGLFAKRFS